MLIIVRSFVFSLSQIFQGNSDYSTVVRHQLNPIFRAIKVRFYPVSWNSLSAMRVELYGCYSKYLSIYMLIIAATKLLIMMIKI